MDTRSPLDPATIAAVMGQPTRAAMLDALMGGRWLTATELARHAGVSATTASEHLARLVGAGLIERRRNGRALYHALAGPDVAEVLEGLGRIAARTMVPHRVPEPMRYARSCYDHLAGRLGVFLADVLEAEGVVELRANRLTTSGRAWLVERLDLELGDLPRAAGRPVVRACLDWSERRDHLAGHLGAAILAAMLERRWMARVEGSRVLRLTARGRDRLQQALARDLP